MTRSSQQTPHCALSFLRQPCLRTQQLFLHRPGLDDAPDMAAGLEDAHVRSLMPGAWPQGLADTIWWINQWLEGNMAGWAFALTPRSKPYGLIGLVTIVPRTEGMQLDGWLVREQWGKGLMTQALKAVIAACFDNTEVTALHSRVLADNQAGLKVQHKAGFQRAGCETQFCVPQGREMQVIHTCLTRESYNRQVAKPAFGPWNRVA
jgi:[ribosomal protein S5]-alanine N-acetyltransferase